MWQQFLRNCYRQAGDRCSECADKVRTLQQFSERKLLASAIDSIETRRQHYAALRGRIIRML